MNSQLSTLNSQRSVELHIEELVLHGFAPGDRYALGDAVETELREVLAKQHLLPTAVVTREIDWIDAGEFRMMSGATPHTIGGSIAKAISHALAAPRHSPQRRP
jgi:hypothetical protein